MQQKGGGMFEWCGVMRYWVRSRASGEYGYGLVKGGWSVELHTCAA